MQEMTFRKTLSRAVRDARRKRGLTQRALAHHSGITEKYLSRIELGLVTPSVFVTFRLCHALAVDLGELLTLAPPSEHRDVGRIARILRGRSDAQLDLARRVLAELFR
jgi:XRE family aerobic/anaerobic benzoate catabolism transcriptional regulator